MNFNCRGRFRCLLVLFFVYSVMAGMGWSSEDLCEKGEVNFTGFFDFGWSGMSVVGDNSKFSIGSFELDIEIPVSDKVSGGAALVFSDGTADIGIAIVDFHFFEKDAGIEHLPRGYYIKHSGLMAGKFDIPFGLDYLVYASPDRKLISIPLSTEKMFDGGWTDIGISPYLATNCFEINAYYLDGENNDNSQDPMHTFGGRISVTRWNNMEFGFSSAITYDKDNMLSRKRTGLHIDFGDIEKVNIKGEYIEGEDSGITAALKHSSYYIQGSFDVRHLVKIPSYAVLRYGEWIPSGSYDANLDGKTGNDSLKRVTMGYCWNINDKTALKLEHQINLEINNAIHENDNSMVQLVLSF